MPGRLEPEALPRRDFLGLAGLWSAGIAVVGSIVGMVRLTKPRVLPEISARFRVGKSQDFSPGTTIVNLKHHVRLTTDEEGIAAMSLVCTHLGCIVEEDGEGFACPCHGSKFDGNGNVIQGPAPSPLPFLKVGRAADGTVVVDKNERVEPQTRLRIV